jgi:uncharacterized coiled-coil protein SlyX
MSSVIYRDHPLRTTIATILASSQIENYGEFLGSLSEEQSWQLDRVFEVAHLVHDYLNDTPSTLVSFTQLAALNATMDSVRNVVTSAITGMQGQLLQQASAIIEDQVLALVMRTFLIQRSVNEPDRSGEIIDDLRTRNQSAINQLKNEKTALEERIKSLTSQVDQQDQRVNELSVAVEAQKKEAVAVTAEVRGEYAKTEKELRDLFEQQLKEMTGQYVEFAASSNERADAHLIVLKGKEAEAREIVQVVGNIGVTGNYKKIAESESKAADGWRWATLGFFGTAVVVAVGSFVWHLFPLAKPDSPWDFAIRFVTAISIALPAFYTSRESARHRTNADRAKQRELELASLGPFIELLPQADKYAITSKLVDRYFGSVVEPHDAKSPLDIKEATELVKVALDGASKIVKLTQ